MSWGLLFINLGTPDDPGVPAVRRYLREFLMDPRVLDIPYWKRWALVNLAILPKRSRESAHAYQSIWTARGSPLLAHGQDLKARVAEALGGGVPVELAMRYQNPSIAVAVGRLRARGVDEIVAFPLFPQYASSSTGSALEVLYEELGRSWNTAFVHVVPPYYDHPAYLDAFAAVGRPVIVATRPDKILFSFHGLPERQILKSEDRAHGGPRCLRSADCCAAIGPSNRNCYRAQCYASARLLAGRLGLAADRWEVAFQSRLGKDPWIPPFTDERLLRLPHEGSKRIVVFSPAFTADCLETVEELGIRGRESFLAAGGEAYELVPCLNSSPAWVEGVVRLARETFTGK